MMMLQEELRSCLITHNYTIQCEYFQDGVDGVTISPQLYTRVDLLKSDGFMCSQSSILYHIGVFEQGPSLSAAGGEN